ncbi:ectonucleoside triphosphate diphosphohydrolase 1 isoform X2 [Parasteatoda tepidariorum]|nr:ectonucleoside triphosphate diphosphohydrolase 1 isoform X2 [Parasteatoda tepidariorum]XP_015920560.1 ectonucleoside triphosphate diphosphohydrolase 1 isoform X2 [Parasteatoda tepidariorum]XP_015920561.1 ectonucleoside triphosphate diphosphohydrolase 1 isoform X2 [Parasteatoda tepidariorum]XP_042905253.1 ectonucleoside triphosphate diphosphohydrolase 1 isoform X2 [Parasteatoda tepidariorum]
MYTLYVESKLAGPLFGSVIVEMNPRENVGNIVDTYLHALQNEEKVPGLAIYNGNNQKLEWNATLESQGIEDGTRVFIGHDRSNFMKPVHVAVIGLSTILIACVLFVVTALLYGTTGGIIPFDYGIVIDAGSAHTEVFLYQWSGEKDQGTGQVHQRGSCEYEVGIASGVDPVNIISCVNNVTSLVPKGSSPVLYLGATAGMRILNLTNPKEASLILTSLKYGLSTSPVQVKTISIIPGEAEALFSWISSNFLINSLYEELSTYGALDLGGASTQYAYAVHNKSLINDTDVFPLKLYGHQYFVKSETFLCFGYIEALYRNEASMFMEIETPTLNDPCLPAGYVEKIDVQSFAQKPCIQSQKFNKWIQNHSITGELLVRGASDYKQCRKNILNLANQTFCEMSGFKYCFPNTNLRGLNMNFTAFSGFYYVVHFLNGTNSLDEFVNSTQTWCTLTWEEIQHTVPESELKHVLQYCFAAIYITELLTNKYGFDSLTWKTIQFTKQIEQADIGWTLGYMINATNAIPEEKPSPPVISLSIFAPLAVLSIALIVIAIIIIKKHGDMNIFKKSHTRLLDV